MDDTGLYYYNARYYDPTIGRFISADPFVQWSNGFDVASNTLTVNALPQKNAPKATTGSPVNSQTLNRYSYVINNPLRFTDPWGWITFGVGIAGSASAVAGITGNVMFVWDDQGNCGLIVSGGGGGFGGSPGGNVGAHVQITSADDIYDLTGITFQAGATLGVTLGPIPFSGTLEGVIGSGYWGGQGIAGFGIPGFDIHGVLEYSTMLRSGTFDNGMQNDSLSLGFLASNQLLSVLGNALDEKQYESVIKTAYESAAETVGAGQILAWSGELGYYSTVADTLPYNGLY